METWQGIKKRKYEEVNLQSRSTAALTSLIEVIASSFGDNKVEFDPQKFLPVHFEDENSPRAKLRRNLGEETIAIAKELLKDELIPPIVCRDLFSLEDLKNILLEDF